MANFKTPGVYVQEISSFPPSAATVETALPAFIGYTTKAEHNGNSLTNVPTRISSLLEFRRKFGIMSGSLTAYNVTMKGDNISKVEIEGKFYLQNAVRMFYANGGGDCYIVSVGPYGSPKQAELLAGLNALREVDEPTMLLMPDALRLDIAECYSLQVQMLKQCGDMQSRVAILDIRGAGDNPAPEDKTKSIEAFRNGIGINYLDYAAAYFPWLNATLPRIVPSNLIKVNGEDVRLALEPREDVQTTAKKIEEWYRHVPSEAAKAKFASVMEEVMKGKKGAGKTEGNISGVKDAIGKLGKLPENEAASIQEFFTTAKEALNKTDKIEGETEALKTHNFNILLDEAAEAIKNALQERASVVQKEIDKYESMLKNLSPRFNGLINAVTRELNLLPPSGAIAGLYALVDKTRGVWKAPANVSINSVDTPSIKITDLEQENMNVDANSGKSINAIREFAGQGTLVWGARTLLGNDNEWRYISVRRFFIMVEQSLRLGSSWAVFEPNDSKTWSKIKGMIRSFLTDYWRQGALAGASPDEAFFVNVGLGSTMDAQDILEGRLNVEIGMAVVRPAEFIILKFSHKLQEA